MVRRARRLEAAGAARDGPAVTAGPLGTSARRHAGPLALLSFLPLVWTFPLVLDLDGAIPGRAGDNLGFLWNFWWMRQALEQPGLEFFRTAHLFAPYGVDLTLYTHTALPAFAGATVLGFLPLAAAHNVVLLCTLFLNAAGAYLLAYRVTASRTGALLAGAIFGGSPYVMAHLQGHFNLISAWGLPILAVLLLRTLDTGSRRTSLAAGACLCAIAYTDYYYLVYALAFSLVWLAARWIAWSVEQRERPPRRLLAARVVLAILLIDVLLAAIIVATGGFVATVWGIRISAHGIHNELTAGWGLFLLWIWLRHAPRVSLSRRPAAAPGRDLRVLVPAAAAFAMGLAPLAAQAYDLWLAGGYVAPPFYWRSSPPGIDLLAPILGNPFHPLWGGPAAGLHRALDIDLTEGTAWIGVVPAVLLCLAWRCRETRRAAGAWLATGAVFLLWSLGPFLTVLGTNVGLVLPHAFLRMLPILSNARTPGRALVVVFLVLAVVAAIAAADAGRRWGRWRTGLTAVLLAGVVLDYLAAPFPLQRLDRPAIYETLARQPGEGTVLELPVGVAGDLAGVRGLWDPRVLFYQSVHGRPLVGGAVSRLAPSTAEAFVQAPVIGELLRLSSGAALAGRESDLSPAAAAAALARFGVRWVVLDRATAPGDLVTYVEATLPLRLLERDGLRELYVVAYGPSAGAGTTPGSARGGRGRPAGSRPAAVLQRFRPAPVPPPDPQQVPRHGQRIAHGPHLALVPVVPIDPDLGHRQVPAPGQVDDLDVVGEARQRLQPEQLGGGTTPEALEAALRVPDAGAEQATHQPVEDPAHQVSPQRFAVAPGTGRLPGTERDVHFRRAGRKQALHLVDGHRQVGVAQQPVLARRRQHAVPDGPSLAPVVEAQEADARVPGGGPAHRLRRGVGAAVVGDDDLPAVRLPREVAGQPLERAGDALLLVVRGNDDRQIRCGIGPAPAGPRRRTFRGAGCRGSHGDSPAPPAALRSRKANNGPSNTTS